ncbi:MAG: phospholipid carrier-dependent glycosyltransferase [Thaumarchaeota archaeon]|nr:phospholipid carrier-dependent glycosyltransferase [Nitrososphaerota archaeon]
MTTRIESYSYLVLALILIISAFTHLWNAAGFPDIFFDEGVYMHRTMHVLDGFGPEEGDLYDHPFFGQIFLAGVLKIIGYPYALNSSGDESSISLLYLIPRILMGILAVIDTFLIFKIAEKRYDKKVALISSALFAVMPISWLFRRILLDNILLPFLLLSILSALYSKDSKHKIPLILLSGICLGLAIFTKIPVFTFLPLVGSLVFFYNQKRYRILLLWLAPVILIPLAWPIQSIESDHFSNWIHDVFYLQTHRVGGSDLYAISKTFAEIDPVLFWLGIGALAFAAFRRDYFLLGWFIPFIIFLYLIGYNQYFYWIPIVPVMCISIGVSIVRLFEKIPRRKTSKICLCIMISGICLFGLVNLVQLINTDMTKAEYSAISYVAQNVKNDEYDKIIYAGPTYSWILSDVFLKQNVWFYHYVDYEHAHIAKTLLIADPHFLIDSRTEKNLAVLYNSTKTTKIIDGNLSNYDTSHYPYQSLDYTLEGKHIEIRTK